MKIAGWTKKGFMWTHTGGLSCGDRSPHGKGLDIAERALKLLDEGRQPGRGQAYYEQWYRNRDVILAEVAEDKVPINVYCPRCQGTGVIGYSYENTKCDCKPEPTAPRSPTVRERVDEYLRNDGNPRYILPILASEIDKLKGRSPAREEKQ